MAVETIDLARQLLYGPIEDSTIIDFLDRSLVTDKNYHVVAAHVPQGLISQFPIFMGDTNLQTISRNFEGGDYVGFIVAAKKDLTDHKVASDCHFGLSISTGDVKLGIAQPTNNLFDLPQKWTEALLALKLGDFIGRDVIGATYYSELDDLALLAKIPLGDLREYRNKFLSGVLEYGSNRDGLKGVDLINTIGVLVRSRSPLHSAEELYIHRNTLLYRLKKVRDVSGFDPMNNEDLSKLEMALKVHRLIPALEFAEKLSQQTS